MSEVLYLRDGTGEACGPGSRERLVSNPAGSSTQTLTLDTTGDTWNMVKTNDVGGFIYPAATWSVDLFLKVAFGASATVIATLARYNSACALQEELFSDNTVVISPFFASHTISASVGRVFFHPGDLLLCVIQVRRDPADIEYGQWPSAASVVNLPDKVIPRPWEYYKKQRRRRSV